MLMSDWEELLEDPEYAPVHHALCAGVTLLEKYYRRADNTDAYFISHGKSLWWLHFVYWRNECAVLDPVAKLAYLEVAWEEKYIEMGMNRLKEQVGFWHYISFDIHFLFQFLLYKSQYEASQKKLLADDHNQRAEIRELPVC